ncbi:MAG: hypothetical protein AUK55_10965 [Syntrophobacteraceae bacterium CG2_30_61_12]|nr:MAG: hypothetical protein AUK55_10965 [Syntrophobacteraceae bacterium CG2_30_61_12]
MNPAGRIVLVTLIAWLVGGMQTAGAQNILQANGMNPLVFLADVAGTVNTETFARANVMIRLMLPSYDDPHPYLLLAEGYPENNARNIFYWISNETTMEAGSNEIVCKLNRDYRFKRANIFFFYTSPSLLEPKVMTHNEEELRELAANLALPVKVMATSAELRIIINSDRITGSVRMAGYDPIESSYVHYQATFEGWTLDGARQKMEKKKNIGVGLVEPGEE